MFGFRQAMGTKGAIFSLPVLIQCCRDINRDVYACFIDFSRAFYMLKHTELVKIMKQVGLDSRDVRIIANLYWNQTAYVNIAGNKTGDSNRRSSGVCPFIDPIQNLL